MLLPLLLLIFLLLLMSLLFLMFLLLLMLNTSEFDWDSSRSMTDDLRD